MNEGDEKGAPGGRKSIATSGGVMSKPVSGESRVPVGEAIHKRKTVSVGVKNLTGRHLELRSRQRSWGGGQAAHDHTGPLE